MLKQIHKNLTREAIKWPSYFEIYERHFNKFVGKQPVVVEVGICHGGSMEMWKQYFGTDARVIGIDIHEDFVNTTIDGCELVLGDQSDPQFWDTFFQTHPDIDIFIDDGGHQAQGRAAFQRRHHQGRDGAESRRHVARGRHAAARPGE